MASGILENDKGVMGYTNVYGKTWHNLPQYEQIDGAVPSSKVEGVIDYSVTKEQAQLANGTQLNSFALVRHDTDTNGMDKQTVIFDAVGSDYTILDNREFFRWLNAGILEPYQDRVSIESVGTLFNGRAFFLNVALGKVAVKGDNSETVNKLMYCNWHGAKGAETGIVTERIVCANTLRMAEGQATANGTLRKFVHTQSVAQKVADAVVDLAKVFAQINCHYDLMNHLASQKMDTASVNAFLGQLFPTPKDAENKRGITVASNKTQKILAIFDDKEDLQGDIRHTKYSMLQAITDYVDHDSQRKSTSDEGYAYYDNILGSKDAFKQKAFSLLQGFAIPETVMAIA